MKYLVMECHPGYAVVLDEDGRFLKVTNQRYTVGQTVTDVVEMQIPPQAPQKKRKPWLCSLAAMAACLLLFVLPSVFRTEELPYASVYLTINPEVRIDVDQIDTVVGLAGENADGEVLIDGYAYADKTLEQVCDELIDRAMEMGFLHPGGQISLTLDTDDDQWIVEHRQSLTDNLNRYLTDKISVTIVIGDTADNPQQVIIPIEPGGDDSDSDEDSDDRDDEDGDDRTQPGSGGASGGQPSTGSTGAGDSEYDDWTDDEEDDDDTDDDDDDDGEDGEDD